MCVCVCFSSPSPFSLPYALQRWWKWLTALGLLSLLRPKISTTLSNQHKFSNIELAKPTNLSIEALRERIEAENREQVG